MTLPGTLELVRPWLLSGSMQLVRRSVWNARGRIFENRNRRDLVPCGWAYKAANTNAQFLGPIFLVLATNYLLCLHRIRVACRPPEKTGRSCTDGPSSRCLPAPETVLA